MRNSYIIVFVATCCLLLCCRPTTKKDGAEEYRVSPDLEIIEDAYHFYVIGDWGRNGEFYQQAVADMMAKAAEVAEPEMIISTGDNIYPNGVASTNDHLWMSSFEEVYRGHALYCPWYVVLGNHDYRGNIQAQIDYTDVSRRWNMPDKYYHLDIKGDDGARARMVFIDTSPFELKYYTDEKYQEAVAQQDTARQRIWMDSVLSQNNMDWKIVIGHHPLYSGGKRLEETEDVRKQLEPIFTKHKVDLYLAGHEHDLQHIKAPGPAHHIISGAGSEIRPTGMMDYSLFAESAHGFAIISLTKSFYIVQMIDYKGNIIYKTRVTK